jgi:cyclopropane-fatty-acyl-phospholipid synthase
MSRRIVHAFLRRLRHGHIEIEEAGARVRFGPPGSDLRAVVRVHHPVCWRALLRGSTGFAESYADGLWDCDDLVALVRIAAREMRRLDRVRRALVPLQRLGRLVPRNTRRRSERHIASHYDLGDELFSVFLDETMTYSCALFEDPGATLAEAQVAKLDRACRTLDLRADDHLLEIGSGWGSLAVHAAQRYGSRVTTITLSEAQHAAARRRVREAGVEDRVAVLLRDYRDLSGRFDKLVSIEMIEAVGWQYFELFFRRCSELLAPDGLMLLQAIVIEDGAYEAEKASRSFINKHVFPGGCLPSLEVISRLARAAGLQPLGRRDLTAHYPETLRRWRGAFLESADRVAALGYDRRFRRLWELYLCYTEAGFRERRTRDLQLLFAGPAYGSTRPETRLEAPDRLVRS